MPLRDHFHPPLSVRRHWHAFHNAWATFISSQLNRQLPPGFFAEPNVQFGIEIDVATFEERSDGLQTENSSSSVPLTPAWYPPAPTLTIPLPIVTDIVEIAVYGTEGGPSLAAAIELVSPANKDRADHRDAFVAKCSTYLQQGVGLVVVDVVTSRTGSLHELLLRHFDPGNGPFVTSELYASAYRPVERGGQTHLDVWHESMAVGRSLPTVPLWLRGGHCFGVDLEASYELTGSEQRLEASAS